MEIKDLTPWMTRSEAAEYLRVSKPTVDRWAGEGRLTRHRLAGSERTVRFRREELDALLEPEERLPEWMTRPPTAENPGCPGAAAGDCGTWGNGTASCDHVWCHTCEQWMRDTGSGPSCTHQPYGPALSA